MSPAVARRQSLRERRAAAWGIEPTWTDRFTDHLHPVLVRELVQATGGMLLNVTGLACLLLLFQAHAALPLGDAAYGLRALAAAERISLGLAVLLCGYVPLRAYLSTRAELIGFGREQLLLGGIGPSSLFWGKLQAVFVLGAFFVGLAGPVLALCVGLRGLGPGAMLTASLGLLLSGVALGALGVAAAAVQARAGAAWAVACFALPAGTAVALLAERAAAPPGAWLIELARTGSREPSNAPLGATLLLTGLAVALGAAVTATALRSHFDRARPSLATAAVAIAAAPTLALARALWPAAPWPGSGVTPLAVVVILPLCAHASLTRPPRAALATVLGCGLAVALAVFVEPPRTAPGGADLAVVLVGSTWWICGVAAALRAAGVRRGDDAPARAGLHATLVVVGAATLPLLLNGLRAQPLRSWNPGQALSPPAVSWRALGHGVDATLCAVLFGAAAVSWLAALSSWPRAADAVTAERAEGPA